MFNSNLINQQYEAEKMSFKLRHSLTTEFNKSYWADRNIKLIEVVPGDFRITGSDIHIQEALNKFFEIFNSDSCGDYYHD